MNLFTAAKKKFDLKIGVDNLRVFMEDGCELCSDEELRNGEIVNGKLLIVAERFDSGTNVGKLIDDIFLLLLKTKNL